MTGEYLTHTLCLSVLIKMYEVVRAIFSRKSTKTAPTVSYASGLTNFWSTIKEATETFISYHLLEGIPFQEKFD